MKVSSDRVYRRRRQILDQARELARSGQHADHTTIIRELEAIEGFEVARIRLEDRAIRSQLDHLCAMARTGMSGPWRRLRTPPHGPNPDPERDRVRRE